MIKFDRSNAQFGYLNRKEILDTIEDVCENCKTRVCRDCGMNIVADHISKMTIVTDDMIMLANLKTAFKEAAKEYESKEEISRKQCSEIEGIEESALAAGLR